MSHTQLENDLLRNANHRLLQWMQDTNMRCTAVDLPASTILAVIASALATQLVRTMVATGFPLEDLQKDIADTYTKIKQRMESAK